MNQTELKLIKQCLRGKRRATESLYQEYEAYWFRICLRYARNRTEAQDLFQEGVAQIFKVLKKYDAAKGEFKSWSARVLVNAALQQLRKSHWQQSFEDLELAAGEADWNERIYSKINAEELTQIIQQLPSGYRVVFNMYEIEGYAHKEIADMLNISVGTSKSQLSKAKKILRQKIAVLFR